MLSIKKVTIGTAIALSLTGQFAHSEGENLSVRYLKTGAADNTETVDSTIDTFKVNDELNTMIRNDKHFSIFSTYALDKENQLLDKSELKYELKQSNFGSVNLAFWMGKAMDYVSEAGFIKNKSMEIIVDAHCKDMFNAYFSPVSNEICIGHTYDAMGREALNGLASFALDAGVVVHEFGHGVFRHVNTLPRYDAMSFYSVRNDQLGAMNEGQADFFAYAITENAKLGTWFIEVFKTFLKVAKPEMYEEYKNDVALRETDNTFSMAKNFFGEIHDDGRIFSGALYDLSKAIGIKPALTLWLEAVTKIQEEHTFYDYALLIIEADKNLNKGANLKAIQTVFTARGILGNAALSPVSTQVYLLVNDRKAAMKVVNEELIKEEYLSKAPDIEVLNENGKLDAGECVTVELQIGNAGKKSLVGVELFVPTELLPIGVTNVMGNRATIGLIKPGKVAPAKILLTNLSRPFLYLCADADYKPENDNNKATLYLKNAAQGALELTATL